MLAAWLKDHYPVVWRLLFALCSLPALVLVLLYVLQDLGPNPLALLLHVTGRTSLVLLTLTLCITPMRRWLSNFSRLTHRRYGKRLSDWNWLVRLRRPLGLWSFAYALGHAWVYLAFDLGYNWAFISFELLEKPYLSAGAVALLILIVLASTSTQRMIRLLGRNWRRLHTLTYVVAVLGLLHFWWAMKPGLKDPWPDTLAIAWLLGYRAALRFGMLERWDGFDGRESQERPAMRVP